MSQPIVANSTPWRVVMLVWNRFISDARVLREARTLQKAGGRVTVIAIRAQEIDATSEVLPSGVQVVRVARRTPRGIRIVMLPRLLMRRAWRTLNRRLFGRQLAAVIYTSPKWWEFDRRLIFLSEELSINFQMFRAAVQLQPQVMHAHDVNTLAPAWMAARRCKAKLVYDAHEISADREGYHGRIWLVKMVERFLGRSADAHITTTEARSDWFEEVYGYPGMTVLQNRPERRIVNSSDRIRREFDIPAECPIILYQGGLQWGRGLRNLLDAVRGLPGVHLAFVGDGVQRPSLEREAADIADRVHFSGMVPLIELPEWTASADIGVQCLRNTCLNHYTTDSNKLFEYVMGGLPVVASDFPEIRKVVVEYDLGTLVDPDNVEQIRIALRELVENKELRERFAANARKAREQLDWSSQQGELLALYGRLRELP